MQLLVPPPPWVPIPAPPPWFPVPVTVPLSPSPPTPVVPTGTAAGTGAGAAAGVGAVAPLAASTFATPFSPAGEALPGGCAIALVPAATELHANAAQANTVSQAARSRRVIGRARPIDSSVG